MSHPVSSRLLWGGGLLSLMLAIPVSARDLKSLSDEFTNASSLSRWIPYHVAEGWPDHTKKVAVDPSGSGTLVLEPWTSGWYAELHAPFLYKTVKGDFSVTTRLQARGRDSEVPERTWSLAGLMVRKPRTTGRDDWKPGDENWLFLTTGVAQEPGKPVFESKTTVKGKSRLELHPARSGWIELRIARTGPAFTLSYRYPGDPGDDWVEHRRFERPDLPEEVQVGLIAYTDWDSAQHLQNDPFRFNTTVIKDGKPDLVTLVDYVRFE